VTVCEIRGCICDTTADTRSDWRSDCWDEETPELLDDPDDEPNVVLGEIPEDDVPDDNELDPGRITVPD